MGLSGRKRMTTAPIEIVISPTTRNMICQALKRVPV